jgi:predicted DNA-binding mobile mystery protein A
MARTSRDPDLVALKRKQLDSRLTALPPMPTPRQGWIRASREALGMSAAQLGKRMHVSQQEATDLERRERSGVITVATLAKAAEAMDCELRVVFVPKTSFEATVRRQAESKAHKERKRVVHTMRLEAQEEGVADALADRGDSDAWLTKRLAHLWD